MADSAQQETIRLPELRDDLRITPLPESPGSYVVEDPLRNLYFRIGHREYRFLCRLGGDHRFSDTADGDLSSEEAHALLQHLAAKQLLKNQTPETLARIDQADRSAKQKRERVSRLNPIIFRVPLFNPDPLLTRIMGMVGWLAGPLFLMIWLIMGFTSVLLILSHWDLFLGQTETFFSTRNMIIIVAIWIGLKLLHEFGHAIACRRHGGRVYEMGILFILFIPLTYVNATSSWSFPRRWQRIQVGTAGMFMELFIAWCAVLYWATHMDSPAGLIAHHTVLVAGISSLVFNANPLMRFDGYYILSDLVNVPNLYFRGLGRVRQLLDRLLFGVRAEPDSGSHPLITFYGIAIYIWRVLVIATLIIIASSLFGGWGLLLAAAALLSLAIQFLGATAARVRTYRAQHPRIIFRFIARFSLLAALCLALLMGVSYRETISAPAVILFEQQDSVRCETAGFIDQILVQDGDRVRAGQELAVLSNDELQLELQDIRLRLAEATLKKRQADATGNFPASQVLQEQISVLHHKQDNLEEDRDGLILTAAGDGIAVGNVDTLIGTYARKGQELMQIIGSRGKQLVASVDQNDISALHSSRDATFLVDMGSSGLGTFYAALDAISPSASTGLEHFAFAAPFGGTLDVRAGPAGAGGVGYEYFNPRFSVYLKLPDELQPVIRSGQRATLYFKGVQHSTGMHVWQEIKRWYKSKQPLS